jgi:flagellar hook-basal body complex protein FliE
MSVQAVSFLPPGLPLPDDLAGPPETAAARPLPDFGAWIERQFNTLNTQLVAADQGVRALATGAPAELHRVMIAMEQAKLSLQLMLQVRNHALEAYQDVIRMPL